MHHITDTLLVGNLTDVQHPPPAISAILFVGDVRLKAPTGPDWSWIPLQEFGEAAADDVHRAVSWLEDRVGNGRVMVCCRAGLGRSVSVVIAYLCCVQGMSYQSALKLVTQRRPGATPLPKLEETVEKVRQLRQEARGTRRIETPSAGPSGPAAGRRV